MVGVPGRSKACNVCKQRKIACSLERPQCAQCIKSKRICTGYQRDRIFITNHGKPEENVQTAKQERLRSFAGREKQDAFPLLRNGHSKPASPEYCTELLLHLTKDVPVRHAFRQQLLSEFIYSYMPETPLLTHGPLPKKLSSWLVLVSELPDLTAALESSVLAICTAKVGRLYDDPVLVRASLKSYGKGLWELQKALWDPELMYRDETLAACMALWMYEVMECPAATVHGWISHFGGCEKLVQLRGPEAYSSALGHQVFVTFRTTAIYQVIKTCQPTYLADSDWIELPWKNIPKRPFDEILDKTAVLANLFVQGWEIEGLTSTSLLVAALKVVHRCWELEAELRQLYNGFESAIPGPLHWPELSTEENPADDAELGKVFPVAFHFPNLMMAFTCMIYWASLILAWAILAQMYQALGNLQRHNLVPESGSCLTCSNSDSDHNTCSCEDGSKTAKFDIKELPALESRIDVLGTARNICQSVEYCMQEDMKSLGASATVIPLMAVIDVLPAFPHCSRELAWAKAAFEKVNQRGFRLMKCVASEREQRDNPEK